MLSMPFDTSALLQPGQAYRCLGVYHPPRGEECYLVAVPGRLNSYRGVDIGLYVALSFVPDRSHWFALFPDKRRKIDTIALRCAIMRECIEAGEYLPPEELRTCKRPGRRDGPKKTPPSLVGL